MNEGISMYLDLLISTLSPILALARKPFCRTYQFFSTSCNKNHTISIRQALVFLVEKGSHYHSLFIPLSPATFSRAILKGKVDNGSPWRTPLFTSNSSETVPLHFTAQMGFLSVIFTNLMIFVGTWNSFSVSITLLLSIVS